MENNIVTPKYSVSVVVVCYNESKNIKECIGSIMSQDYPSDKYELLLVDNGSTDGTYDIIKGLSKQYGNIRVVINPIRSISRSRNVGLRESYGDLIAFTDADCVVPANWLKTLVDGFLKYKKNDPSLCAAGGSNIPPKNRSRFYDTLGIFLDTFLGSGGSVQGRIYGEDRYLSHLPTVNVIYDKKIVSSIGGFDESLGSISEDQDLSTRLTKNGYRLVYLAGSFVWHKLRGNPLAWAKNMFTYGKGRVWYFKKHHDIARLHLLLPALLVLNIVMLISPWRTVFLMNLMIYAVIILLISAFECLRVKRIDLIPDLALLYIITHCSYGMGELYGILSPIGKNNALSNRR